MFSSNWLSLLALLAAAGTAQAADHGFYLGLSWSGVSPDYAEPQMTAFPTDQDPAAADTPSRVTGDLVDSIGSQGFKGVVGYRVLDWLAFEADYLDLGSDSASLGIFCVTQPCPDTVRAETSSASLSALAMWPLGKFDVFARLGISRWESSIEGRYNDGTRFWSQDLSGTDEKYGAGAQFHIHKLTARLEYEHLRFAGDAADTWSIGIAYLF